MRCNKQTFSAYSGQEGCRCDTLPEFTEPIIMFVNGHQTASEGSEICPGNISYCNY